MREGIRPPKFADKFSLLDFEAQPLPAISLYPMPEQIDLSDVLVEVSDLSCSPRRISWTDYAELETVRIKAPFICQIFNWSEVVEWGGVRLADFLNLVGIAIGPDDYVACYSRDGVYFESLPAEMALDPQVLLATEINGRPLPRELGGPLRLVVPFLQGYKSVKWLRAIRVTRHDPVGIKRLLGQSKTGHLGFAWRQSSGIDDRYAAGRQPV